MDVAIKEFSEDSINNCVLFSLHKNQKHTHKKYSLIIILILRLLKDSIKAIFKVYRLYAYLIEHNLPLELKGESVFELGILQSIS